MATTERRLIAYEEARDIFATKADIAKMETRLADMETRLVKWMVGMMLGGMATAATLALVAERLLGI